MAATHPLARLALGLVAGLACAVTLADWQPDPDDKRQARAAAAIDKFRESRPGIEVYFDDTTTPVMTAGPSARSTPRHASRRMLPVAGTPRRTSDTSPGRTSVIRSL